MLKNKFVIICLILLGGVLWACLYYWKFTLQRSSSVNAYSKNAMGLSIFDELGNEKLTKKLTPFLRNSEIESNGLLLILSPQMPISYREAKVISRYVSDGGTLIASFHNEVSLESLEHLLSRLRIEIDPEIDQAFENRKTQIIETSVPFWLFKTGRSYSLYSNLLFDNASCQNKELECYVIHKSFGNGSVTLISGLVPFINGLIAETDNLDIAKALHAKYFNIVTDEYHHFYSEKNGLDLLLTPQVSLPILGLSLGALLFFLFGYNRLDNEGLLPTKLKSVRSYHDINRALLSKVITLPGSDIEAREIIISSLKEYFPTQTEQIEDLKNKDLLTIAKFHLSELQNRRGK